MSLLIDVWNISRTYLDKFQEGFVRTEFLKNEIYWILLEFAYFGAWWTDNKFLGLVVFLVLFEFYIRKNPQVKKKNGHSFPLSMK